MVRILDAYFTKYADQPGTANRASVPCNALKRADVPLLGEDQSTKQAC